MNVEKITEVTTYNLTLTKDEYTVLAEAMRYICAVPKVVDLLNYRTVLGVSGPLLNLRDGLVNNL